MHVNEASVHFPGPLRHRRSVAVAVTAIAREGIRLDTILSELRSCNSRALDSQEMTSVDFRKAVGIACHLHELYPVLVVNKRPIELGRHGSLP